MSEARLRKLGVGKRTHDDTLFADGDSLCKLYIREGILDIDDEQLCHQIVPLFPCEVPGCTATFSSLLEFEMHYNSRHRFICGECRKPLPSAHLLDLHLSETHDSFFAAQAERKPMFRCFVEECLIVSQDVSQRRSHCIEAHKFPHDFRYDQSFRKNKKINQELKLEGEHMHVDDVQDKRPHMKKHFTFGHSKQGKSFSKTNKLWHSQEKNTSNNNEQASEITSIEPMDTTQF